MISCQVPPPPAINEKASAHIKDRITMPKKQATKPKDQKVDIYNTPVIKSSKKTFKADNPKIQAEQISQELNPLPKGIKVIVKEIEEPVGRDQSQAQVEAFVLQKAKRLAVEEAGTYISSLQVVKQGQMTEEQVNALASGILQTEIVGKPQIRTKNGVMFVKVKSRIQVDTTVLGPQVAGLMKNKSMMSKLAQQQARIKELESQISGLKQSDIKRLKSLNSQTLEIEKQRDEQRHFLEQQRLAARKAIKDAQLKQIQREQFLNQELQQILKAQETARKQEQEAIAREQDRIKRARLENEAALQELARKAQIRQASWQPLDQSLSAQQALEEARNLRKEIANVLQSLDKQYNQNLSHLKTAFEKQIQFTKPNFLAKPTPRDMFETTEEYQRRMAKHEKNVQHAKQKHAQKIDLIRKEQALDQIQLKKEWLTQKKKILAPFVKRLETLQSKKFTVPDIPITLEIVEPEADRSRFPMVIMCQGERYQRYWEYSDRQAARNLWKTREYFQSVGVQQLNDSKDSISFKVSGCYVTHHGINDKRFYSFQNVKTLNEIAKWNDLDSITHQVYNNEINERKAVMSARLVAGHPIFMEPITGIEFILIPGGCFEMGCGKWSQTCSLNEQPVHRVCLSSYYMAKYEVTQTQWQKIMGKNPALFSHCGGNCPIEQVSWRDVQLFIKRLNKKNVHQSFRLPTEAEWEYACRSGGKDELYCGGNNLDALGWYDKNSNGKTHPVGLKKPNSLKLFDMTGNVWEWCQDTYHGDAYSKHALQSPVLTDTDTGKHVARGGSWSNTHSYCQSISRNRFKLAYRNYNLGFRIVFSKGQ
jgi:formylglycine-generating enzyme required for sulfatase activity